jgi:quercetin dioxygenase-like cupin family protein
MKTTSILMTAALALLASTSFADDKAAAVRIVPSADSKWAENPALPKAVLSSLVFGDPKVGPYIVLLKIPAGTTLMPHTHSAEEVTTVVSGTLLFGTGDKVDAAKATELAAGGYVQVPAKAPHWARAKTDVITVRFANGPGDVIYVDPKDDPRKK